MRKPRTFTWKSLRPEVLERRRRACPPHEVAGAVHPRAGVAERVGDEPVRGQVGAAEVAARQLRAGEVQLARHAGGHRVQPRVEHVRPACSTRARRSAPSRRARRRTGPSAVTVTAASVGPYRLCSSGVGDVAEPRRPCSAGSASPMHEHAPQRWHQLGRLAPRRTPTASTARSAPSTPAARAMSSGEVRRVAVAVRGRRRPAVRPSAAASRTPTPTRRTWSRVFCSTDVVGGRARYSACIHSSWFTIARCGDRHALRADRSSRT